MVVLDTDHLSLLEWSGAEGSAPLRARLATLQPAEVVTTIISYEEQVRGWMAYADFGQVPGLQVEDWTT